MKPKNKIVIPLVLAVATGGFIATTLLLPDYGPSHHYGLSSADLLDWVYRTDNRRSLFPVPKFVYDPNKVVHYVPKTELPQRFIDESNALNPYPLRDLPRFKEKNRFVLPWLVENFSFHDSCMDFQCNSDVDLCDNAMQTEYHNPDGTPPCCTHILRDMLHAFDDGMQNLGVTYFVGFGTLLGLVRSGRVVPWTIDNDIVLENVAALRLVAELWDTKLTGLMLIFPSASRVISRGVPRMCATRDYAGGQLRKWEIPTPIDAESNLPVLFHDRGFPYIDFYFGMEREHGTWGDEYRRCRHLREDVFPVRRFTVYNGKFALNFPANPVALLNRYYGEDWMVPKRDDSGHGKPLLICRVNYGLEDPPEASALPRNAADAAAAAAAAAAPAAEAASATEASARKNGELAAKAIGVSLSDFLRELHKN